MQALVHRQAGERPAQGKAVPLTQQPSNSGESAQTAGQSQVSHLDWSSFTQPHAAAGCAALPPSAAMSPTAAKLAIREALTPLSAAELACVQEQLRHSRLARQCCPLGGGAWDASHHALLTQGSCSSGSAQQASAGTLGIGEVVHSVAAALSAGTVATADVARVLGSLDPGMLAPMAPLAALPYAPLASHHHQLYSAHPFVQQAALDMGPLSPAGCPGASTALLGAGGSGTYHLSVLSSSLQLPSTLSCAATPTAGLARASSMAASGGSAHHPGATAAKRHRSSGSLRRLSRASPRLDGLTSSHSQQLAPAAAAPPAWQHVPHPIGVAAGQPAHGSSRPAPTSLGARFGRLPAHVQAELLAQLDELAAGEDDIRAARGGKGSSSAEPGGPRRSGRARRVRDWDSGGFTPPQHGDRSASPDAEHLQQGSAATPRFKRARLDTSDHHQQDHHQQDHHQEQQHDHHHPAPAGAAGQSSPQLSAAGEGVWCPREPLTLDPHDARAPRRRRVVRKAGARAEARKAMHRSTFRRGKPQRAPAL